MKFKVIDRNSGEEVEAKQVVLSMGKGEDVAEYAAWHLSQAGKVWIEVDGESCGCGSFIEEIHEPWFDTQFIVSFEGMGKDIEGVWWKTTYQRDKDGMIMTMRVPVKLFKKDGSYGISD